MKRILIIVAALLLLVSGCAGRGKKPAPLTPPAQEPSADVAAADTPDYGPVGAFSFALFNSALAEAGKNPALSPLSAYLCLAMLQNGAEGETLGEFAHVLGADTDRLNATNLALLRALSDTDGSTALHIANSAWADDDTVRVDEAFLRAIADYYGAEAFSVDLPSDAAKQAVNAWVSEKTQGLIPSLREDNYPANTRLVLINTLYFKAQWRAPFWADNSFDDDFTTESGQVVRTPFMHKYEAHFDYIQADGADGVILPYDDGKTAFVALRPADGATAAACAAALNAESFAAMLDGAASQLMDLSLPKFEAETSIELNAVLKALGLRRVFDPAAAELSRMGSSEPGPLFLSLVQQKVRLIVDEKGTEAAAVTEAAAAGSAFTEEQPLDLTFDRPFVYAVVDLDSGLPLFLGILDNPAE